MTGLEGKTAFVTGGAGGIGSALCETLLRHGCRVYLHDLPASNGESKARAYCERFGPGRAVFASAANSCEIR